jgi:hypothetical protein
MINDNSLLLALVALVATLGAVPATWAVQAIMDRYDRLDVQIWFELHHLRPAAIPPRDVETRPPAPRPTPSVAGTYSPDRTAPRPVQGVPATAGTPATSSSSGRVAGRQDGDGPHCDPDRVRVVVFHRSRP